MDASERANAASLLRPAESAAPVADGTYTLSLSVDRYVGIGTLTMFQGNGQGHDGTFKIEIHVSGPEHDLKGVINVLLVTEVARQAHLPAHFSLAVSGSGDRQGFDLIGRGPNDVIVEVASVWQRELTPSTSPDWL